MILLDTNVISELMKTQPDAAVLNWVDAQLETDLFLCAISKAEIEWGIGQLVDGKRKQQLQQAASAVFALFAERCLTYDCTTASHYAMIALQTQQSGRPMSVEDMMIAAIARTHHALLVTRNIKDFIGLPDMPLFNPWDHSKE